MNGVSKDALIELTKKIGVLIAANLNKIKILIMKIKMQIFGFLVFHSDLSRENFIERILAVSSANGTIKNLLMH